MDPYRNHKFILWYSPVKKTSSLYTSKLLLLIEPPNILIGVGACIKRADSLKFSFSFCDKKLDAKSFICHKIYYLSGKNIIIPKLFSHNQKWLNTFKYLSTYLRRNSPSCIQNFLTNQYVSKAHLEVKNAHLLTIFSSIRR